MGNSQAIRLGPFIGGLNTASDPTAVADAELVDVINFELDIDGSYVCRPPLVETTNDSASWTERIVIIGRAVLAGGTYVIGSNVDGTYAFDGTTWTLIKAGLTSRVALQFQDYIFIVAQTGSVQNGGYWDGATFTTDASMPKGEAAVFHKARMFVAPGITATGTAAHQVKYTDPISIAAPVPLVWPASGVVSVGQGDGEHLVDIIVYNDNLMLFKQDSTYALAYDLQPVDAVLRKVNNNIGATTRHCVVLYENSVFVYHEGNVFEVINYDFKRINFKVPFLFDGAAPATRDEEVFISTIGDRLVVRYYNRIYVYGLKTKTWTRWESLSEKLHNFGPFEEFPSNPTQAVNVVYYAGSSISTDESVICIADGYDAVTAESTLGPVDFDIECSLTTKNYDLADSHHYKKLFWWGADILSNRDIQGMATPVVTSFSVTWHDLSTLTWEEVSTRTWYQPLIEPFTVTTDITDTDTLGRKFVKLLQALRWRQINFTVKLLSNGTTAQGPCRLFSLTAIIGSKQSVVKQVN